MDPLFQDVVVTIVASGAALVLVQRVRGIVLRPKQSGGCDGCPKCDKRRRAVD